MSDKTPKPQANNPLHGLTLESIVTQLHEHYGWETLASRIDIRCFKSDPSVKSSLKFLRKTPWAREKVETLYLRTKFKKQPSASTKASKPQKPTKQQSSDTISPKPADIAKPENVEQVQLSATKPPEPTPQPVQATEPSETAKAIEPSETAKASETDKATEPSETTKTKEPSETANAKETSETAKATPPNKEKQKRRFAGGKSASSNNKRSF